MQERQIYGQEPEQEEGSIVDTVLAGLQHAGRVLGGIPGVKPLFKGWMWTGEAFGGAGSATLRVGRDIIKEEGVGTFLKESAIEALPFKGSEEYTGRYRKMLAIEEEDGIKARLDKARAWQQERDSAFWGEKFLSEVLFDPLNLLPVGTIAKLGVRGAKAATPAGRAAARAARLAEDALPETGIPLSLADFNAKQLTKKQMVARGADGKLTRAIEIEVPIDRIQGLEPLSAAPAAPAAPATRAGEIIQVGISPKTGPGQRVTPFFSKEARAGQLEAERLMRFRMTAAGARRGEQMYRDLVEEGRGYMEKRLTDANYQDVSVSPNFGKFGDPEPSLYVTARVTPDMEDAFLRDVAEIADVDFAQSSVMITKTVADATPLGVVSDAAGKPAYSIEPTVRFMTPQGKVLGADDYKIINKVADDAGLSGYASLPDGKGIEMFNVSTYGGYKGFQKAIARFNKDDRLREVFGRVEDRRRGSGTKKLWHYGVDGKDGQVGYDALRRSDDPAKAAAKGRSPADLTDAQKNTLAQQHYDAYRSAAPGTTATQATPIPVELKVEHRQLVLHSGNQRVQQAIANGDSTISAFVQGGYDDLKNVLPIDPGAAPAVGLAGRALANIPTEDALKREAFSDNKMRQLARWTVKKSGIPLIRQALSLVNPAGLVSAAKNGDQAAKVGIFHLRRTEMIDRTVTDNIVKLKALGRTSKIFRLSEDETGNLMVNLAKPGKPDKLEYIQTVFENPKRFKRLLNKEQKKYMRTADELIDAWKELAKREGLNLTEIGFEGEQHYFPRFVAMVREVENYRKGLSGGASQTPSFFRHRLYEDIEDAIQNGVVYFGARSQDPVADMVQTYMRSIGRAVANKRMSDDTKALGTTAMQRLFAMEGGAFVYKNHKRLKKSIKDYARALTYIDLPELGQSRVKFLNKLNTAPNSSGLTLSQELAAALKLPRKTVDQKNIRKAELARIRKFITGLRNQAITDEAEVAKGLTKMKAAVRSPIGSVKMPEPEFAGYLFDPEDVAARAPFFTTSQDTLGGLSRGLTVMSTLSGISRTASLTFDFGAGLLQGAMVLTKSPTTWVKAFQKSLHAFADPTVRYKYLDSKAEILNVYKNLHIGSTEMTEIIQPGGQVANWLGHVPGLRLPTETAQRFATSFETFFDVARLEMAEAFLDVVKKGKVTPDQVASHLNKMTGVLSSRALGVSATQRELESALFTLAPRWFRATTALFADGIQGGWEGNQARRQIGKFFAGTVAAYTGIAMGLQQAGIGDGPKLDPRSKKEGGDGGEFMTVMIGGQHIGLGGKPYSMMRYLVKMATDPDNQGRYAQQFFRGQAAPVTSSLWDIMSGETFIGEPVRSPGEVIKDGILPRFMPFYLESFINDDPRPGMAALPAEIVGMRTYPELPETQLDDVRDELAAYVTNLTPDQKKRMEDEHLDKPEWGILSLSQRNKIERGEYTGLPEDKMREFEKLSERVKERRKAKFGNKAVNEFMHEIEDARVTWEIGAQKRQKEFDDGRSGPKEFLDDMRNEVNRDYATAMDRIHDKEGANEEAIAFFRKQNADKKFIPMEDIVRSIYLRNLVGNPDLMDEYDNYDYEKANREERALRIEFGNEVVDAIEREFRLSKEAPPLWKRWMRDREILRPYWDLRDQYLRRHPSVRAIFMRLQQANNRRDIREAKRLKQDPAYRRMEIELRQAKMALREDDPQLDGTMVFWQFADNVVSEEALRYIY